MESVERAFLDFLQSEEGRPILHAIAGEVYRLKSEKKAITDTTQLRF